MMKHIAVLIPVFNHLDYTKSCITAINKEFDRVFSAITISVIVIDDGSTDGTGDWLRSNHPDVIVLEGDGNLWWSGGVNVGAKYAIETLAADYVLLWNNDIITDGKYFSELDTLVSSLSEMIIAGSKIYRKGGNNDVIWSCGGIFNPRTGTKYMLGFNKTDSNEYEKPLKSDWLPGMGTLIPCGVISDIGYWDDKNFPQYDGDSDFTYRAKLAGYENIVYPGLKLWNDTTNTGLAHKGSLNVLMRLLTDIKSNYNLRKNLCFYRKYAESIFAYKALFRSYYKLFGGFFKWKLLSVFGAGKNK